MKLHTVRNFCNFHGRCYFLSLSLLRTRPNHPSPNLTTQLHSPFSTESWLSVPGNPLIKWPEPAPKPELQPNSDPPATTTSLPQPHQNPNPDFSETDFSTICNLIMNPSVSPGSDLESELERTGVEPDSGLLEAVFGRFDSSPKPLFTLYRWAAQRPGFRSSASVFHSMINMLGKAREFDSAWLMLLDRIDEGDGAILGDAFTIMIRRYARAGLPQSVMRTYEFACTLDLIRDSESESESNLFAILLDSLCKEGHVREATVYFDRRRGLEPSWVPPIRVYNILLNGWFRSRKLKHAERLWMEMKLKNVRPNVVTYGTLVEGYCRMRRVEIAIDLVEEMKREGIEPNAVVYNPIVDALGEAGRFKEALGMMERFFVSKQGPTISTYNSLVKGFCKARDLVGASKILKMMISKGVVPTPTTYNYFFRHFSKFGKIEEGMNLYTKMIESGFNPDRLTYHLLMKMLCEEERLELAMQVCQEMRAGGCDLDLATSTMLVHLLCKMHRMEEAFFEFEYMIRKGIVPQYLTFRRVNDELKKQGMIDMAQKLRGLMATVPHSTRLPNTYVENRDASRARRTSIIQKAEAMSDILKTCRDPRELIKRRTLSENAVLSANRLIEDIKKRLNRT